MPRDWLTADDITAMVDDMVVKMGEAAFPHNGRAHLYSGPSKIVWNQILGLKTDNHDRAVEWAKNNGVTLIDDTPVGKFLDQFEGIGTFEYFKVNPRVPDAAKFNEAIKPWKHASRLFIAALWGDVTTTICGANRQGVYYGVELPSAINPGHIGLSIPETIRELLNPRAKPIETINEIPMVYIERYYQPSDYEPAHRLVGLGEQRMALHQAFRTSSPAAVRDALKLASAEILKTPADAYRYFLESQERYRIDRKEQLTGTPAETRPCYNQTPEERQKTRETQLMDFVARGLERIEAEIDPSTPASIPFTIKAVSSSGPR